MSFVNPFVYCSSDFPCRYSRDWGQESTRTETAIGSFISFHKECNTLCFYCQ